jgi:multidrug efflux pump subunit AcrA (membrane-fusion protein)
MRKFSKYFSLIISVCLFISSLTACGKPSAASLGIERPTSSIAIAYEEVGLGVYGSIETSEDNKTAQIEIDTADLPKIKVGYSISKGKIFPKKIIGTVKSLPNPAATDSGSKCIIEASLKDNVSISPVTGNLTKPDATINLPPRNNYWCIFNSSIQDGNDGKKYVWAAKNKDINSVLEEDWQLVKVKTGETDGMRTEITSGLKPGDLVMTQFSASDILQ